MKPINVASQILRRSGYSLRSLILFCFLTISCEDFVEIDPPRTDLIKTTVFASDASAEAAVLDIYYQMRSAGFASGTLRSISFLGSLCSDEQVNYYTSSPEITLEIQQFNDNTLLANNSYVLGLWSDIYECIYRSNAVIEGLNNSKGISDHLRMRLEGEAKFMRAFCHFYLVNLWGDVPSVRTTDYRVNEEIRRTAAGEVYNHIISDLMDAQKLLPEDYSFSNNERVRVNRSAAIALLARTYLYSEDWANAEIHSTQVINNTSLYALVADLNDVSIKNNSEAIWQLWTDYYPNDIFTFYAFGTPTYGAIRPEFVTNFEPQDQRAAYWVGSITPYYFSTKYSSFTPLAEYSVVLRLAEQYLIRAEARAHLSDVEGAQDDLNVIRNRAGLGATSANNVESLLLAIEQERRSELFNEWGHRWLDLKRTNRADAILSPIKAQWTSTSVLFPIPEYEIKNNLGLTNAQNPGY